MKQSSIPFCPFLPNHWREIPNKYLFNYHSAKVGDKWNHFQLLSLTTSGVKPKDINSSGGKVPDSYAGYQTVEPGDMVFCLFDLDVSAVFSGLSNLSGMITSAYDVVKPSSNLLYQKFSDYWFQFVFSNRYYKIYSKNIRYTIGSDMFGSIKTPIPPMAEQIRIGDFLDKKCSEIDSLIAVEEALIVKLSEYKSSVIRSYVVNGFTSKKPLKDTSIRWIGKCPADWRLVPAKSVVKIENGSDPKTEGTVPVYGSGAESFRTCGEFKNGPTVLLGRKGATLHIPHYITGKYWNVDTAFDVHTKTHALDLKYFYYLAICFDYGFYKSQTTLPSMTQTSYGNIVLPLPPITEQIEIVRSLEESLKNIDSLVNIKRTKINLLEDYKKTLVFECVTGKKELA